MKTIFHTMLILAISALMFQSCKETPFFNKEAEVAPAITSFSPAEGPAGTLITVKGVGLQHISEAYIGEQKVSLKNRVSDEELVIEATATGRTGPITLKDGQISATGTGTFTYTYVTPQITVVPGSLTVGDISVIKGVNLNAVAEIYVGNKKVEIISAVSNEVAFKVPFVADATVKISIRYFDGTSQQTLIADQSSAMNTFLPVVQSLSSATPKVGQTLVLTGNNLNYIDSVKIGNTNMVITAKTATSLSLGLVDNTSEFADGNNTLPLVFYSYQAEYVHTVQNIQYYVPSYYFFDNRDIYGRHRDHANNNTFFCLETGLGYTPNTFDSLDPLVNTKKKTSTNNSIDKTLISKAEYESVMPYFHLYDLGSNISIWSPAQQNSVLKGFLKDVEFKTPGVGSGGTSITNGGGYSGTPVLAFRILDPSVAAEAAVIDQVKNQSFSQLNFTQLLMDSGISFSGTSASGLSNAIVSSGTIIKASTAPASLRTFSGLDPFPAGGVYGINADVNPDAVIAVFYFKYNNTSTTTISFANVQKTGFLWVKKYTQTPATGSSKLSLIFDVYWQRTPNP